LRDGHFRAVIAIVIAIAIAGAVVVASAHAPLARHVALGRLAVP
jgi:hypothetical protein